jgi:NAD(P)-dependent dehydrogenase (short-subunit alcohol dehydrogenase family)
VPVNNAAYQMSREAIEDITPDEFERTFRTNVFAMPHLCRVALPRMKPGESIINTASIRAFDPSPNAM